MVGYESGNEQILKNIKKGVGVERARRFTSDCHDLGILIHGTFILGLPGETRDTIEETIRFAQGDAARDAPGVARVAVSRARRCTTGCASTSYLTVDSLVDETGYQKCTVSYPEVSADEIFRAVETFYRALLLQPALHLEVGQEDGARPRGAEAAPVGGAAVPRRDVEAPPDRAAAAATRGPLARAS